MGFVKTRLIRVAACAVVWLFATSAIASPPAAAKRSLAQKARVRQEEARRFLARRGILSANAAASLALARRMDAERARSARGVRASATSALNQPWQAVGPAQVTTSAYGDVTGRVTGIAADPSDSTGNTVYLGTTGGGVWKSTNAAGPAGTVAFAPLTDNLPVFTAGSVASLSIGAISVQPGGTGVVLAGTGDPSDALDSYYGTGLLRSADGGLSWSLIAASNDLTVNSLENFYFFGLAFAGFAWSTQSPNVVVAAVSQSAQGVIVGADQKKSAGGEQPSLLGLYYSTDAGQTWLMATITDGPARVVQSSLVPPGGGGNAATAVVWNPVRNRFYAAVRFHGYYESPDGVTWNRLTNQPGLGLTSVECPANPNRLGSPACPIFRGALAAQPVTGDLFALTVDVNLLDQGLWQDVCQESSGVCASNTVTFTQQLPSAALEDGAGAIELGDYNLSLTAVAVTGDTLLFAGTEDIFRCGLAAGCVFRNTTQTATCAAAQVAPFQHAIDATFAGTLSLIYFGNDSGLWRSADNVGQSQTPCSADDAAHFENLNSGLGSLAEVQELAEDPSNPAILLAGLGVNGTAAAAAAGQTVWPQVLDGYGSYVAIDGFNPQNWYAQSSSGAAIDLCTQGSACTPEDFDPVIGYAQVGNDAFAFPQPAPFLLDPLNSANLILGTCHVWRGPADGLSWSSANMLGQLYAGEGPDCEGNAAIQSLGVSGSGTTGNGEVIYAGMVGLGIDPPQAFAGHLFAASVTDSVPVPPIWKDLWLSPVSNYAGGFNPQAYTVSSVIIDPHDPSGQTVYASIQGFDSLITPTASVFTSTNGGANWLNIRSNLPSVPVNSLAVDPNDANTVYAALDTGVYVATAVTTCSTQNCWSVYGSGLPNSPIVQLATFNAGGQSLLRAATYGRGIWQIPLITAGAAFTTASLTPASLSFAAQQVQTRSPVQTVTVTNTGSIPLIVTQVVATGDFTVSNGCITAVAVGGSCSVQVNFTPAATGLRSGTLTTFLNVASGQITMPLSGNGLPGGAIVLLPVSMNFGSSPIGLAVTPAQNVTISNTGVVAVALQVPTESGDSDFSIVANTCTASLAPNFGCTVALTFVPAAAGMRTGTFSITDDAGTQTAALSGIGLAPPTDAVSPVALSFSAQVVGSSSAAQAITLTNSGDSPLTEIAVSVAGDFQAANGCGNSLIGHASCSVNVKYVPTMPGPEAGTLTIDDVFGRPQAIALSGTGLAPPGISALPTAIDFGAWGVAGSSPAQAVTVTNSGGVPLGAFTFSITGDFSETTDCPLSPSSQTLAAGASCTVQVIFSPAQPGPLSGLLIIASSPPTPSFQVAVKGNGFGFSMQAEGTASATIAAGQTASYLLQIDPETGSIGTLNLTCAGAPPNSTCTVNPSSLPLASGVTASITVTIATVAATSSTMRAPGPTTLLSLAGLFPAGLLLLGLSRMRRHFWSLSLLLLVGLLPLSCGVNSTSGPSTPSSGNGSGTTPPSTYNPVITATGPGISQNVQLTLIVD